MQKWIGWTILALTLAAASAAAKDVAPVFKTAEAKHFTAAEGVELTPSFYDYFYAEMRNELKKSKLVNDVIGEGEAVDDADAEKSVVISGTVSEYKKGSVVKSALTGFGMRSLKMDADVTRRSDKQSLSVIHVHVKVDPRWNEKTMAKFAAQEITRHMKKEFAEKK